MKVYEPWEWMDTDKMSFEKILMLAWMRFGFDNAMLCLPTKGNEKEKPQATIVLRLFHNATVVEIEGAGSISRSRLQRSIRHVFTQLAIERRKIREAGNTRYKKAMAELEEMKNV